MRNRKTRRGEDSVKEKLSLLSQADKTVTLWMQCEVVRIIGSFGYSWEELGDGRGVSFGIIMERRKAERDGEMLTRSAVWGQLLARRAAMNGANIFVAKNLATSRRPLTTREMELGKAVDVKWGRKRVRVHFVCMLLARELQGKRCADVAILGMRVVGVESQGAPDRAFWERLERQILG